MADKRNRNPFRREAIELLKNRYLDGHPQADDAAIRGFLLQKLKIKPAKLSLRLAVNWDRQARDELHATGVSISNPVRQFAYDRDPQALAPKRITTRGVVLKDILTRDASLIRMLRADVQQPDVSPREEALLMVMESAHDLLVKASAKYRGQQTLPAAPVVATTGAGASNTKPIR
jgi:hypothetical protein